MQRAGDLADDGADLVVGVGGVQDPVADGGVRRRGGCRPPAAEHGRVGAVVAGRTDDDGDVPAQGVQQRGLGRVKVLGEEDDDAAGGAAAAADRLGGRLQQVDLVEEHVLPPVRGAAGAAG